MIADLSRNRRIALALEVVFELFIAIAMKIACSGIVGLIVQYSYMYARKYSFIVHFLETFPSFYFILLFFFIWITFGTFLSGGFLLFLNIQ